MTIYALVSENSPVRLWGLSSAQRLQRQLKEISKESPADLRDIQWLKKPEDAPSDSRILVLNGSFLFENRTLKGVLERLNAVLRHTDTTAAAAFIDAEHLQPVLSHMQDASQPLPADLNLVQTADMEAFDENLRRSTQPLLEIVSEAGKAELENRLYGNAYRGITDLVTKFAWPRPAKRAVHLCAALLGSAC